MGTYINIYIPGYQEEEPSPAQQRAEGKRLCVRVSARPR